jgi:hypothetical protein
VISAALAAMMLAAFATPRVRLGSVRAALGLVAGWAAVAAVGPAIAGDPSTPLSGGESTLTLIAVGAGAAALVLVMLRMRERRADTPPAIAVHAPALGQPAGERIS